MESPFYRENLESVLEHFGHKHLLSPSEVCAYTGLKDTRTVQKFYPYFMNGYISTETLAKCLGAAPPKGLKKQGRRLA